MSHSVADCSAQYTSVLISGASGPNAKSINGFYDQEEVNSDGYPYYSKDGDNMCIEHLEGRWEIKPGSSLGTKKCFAFVAGTAFLTACTSRVWSVFCADTGVFLEKPNLKMTTGYNVDHQASCC